MARTRTDTRAGILKACKEIVRREGVDRLTFDAVAAKLGVSKQAVIYWFPTKEDLIAGYALPALRDEARAAVRAARSADNAAAAMSAVVHAIVRFHLRDLDRFRLMYVAIQASGRIAPLSMPGALADTIHGITGEMYTALAERLSEDGFADPRRKAVATHMAALGLVLMASLADAMDDPLAHQPAALADTMAHLISGGGL